MLSSELLEKAILEQQELGRKVRGFIFCNPNNPLGAVYSWDLTRSLMAVCAKHQVHFIADEIYALSVYGNRNDFKSVLSIPENEVSRYLDKLICVLSTDLPTLLSIVGGPRENALPLGTQQRFWTGRVQDGIHPHLQQGVPIVHTILIYILRIFVCEADL